MKVLQSYCKNNKKKLRQLRHKVTGFLNKSRFYETLVGIPKKNVSKRGWSTWFKRLHAAYD